ncbi:extracellular solute-binding protein [Microbacterium suwonense]|nr:extracellular solute-binding protein [Microbacterium suwonense]
MELNEASISRRNLLRGAATAALLLPFGATLASCAAPGGGSGDGDKKPAGDKTTADNPFGVAANSKVDAVIFDGGYGIDYVENSAKIMEGNKNLDGVTVKVASSTKIAQELQPRFVGGNPPDLIDNSGANSIGWNTILDQLEELDDVLDSDSLEGTKISDTLFGGVKAPGTFDGRFVALNYVMTVYGIWYSSSLFEENGWTVPTSWQDLKALGAAAKEKGKYLFLWGKEAATYYNTMVVDSAVIQAGDDFRIPFENLDPKAWSHPAIQSILEILHDLIASGYVKPGGGGTQFTQAQAQWSLDQDALLYPSGSWIENEMKKTTADNFKMKGFAELPSTATRPHRRAPCAPRPASRSSSPRRRRTRPAARSCCARCSRRSRQPRSPRTSWRRRSSRARFPPTASAPRRWFRSPRCWRPLVRTSSPSSRPTCTE